jgi:hypothetical protein
LNIEIVIIGFYLPTAGLFFACPAGGIIAIYDLDLQKIPSQ